jgi:hypothetical protein
VLKVRRDFERKHAETGNSSKTWRPATAAKYVDTGNSSKTRGYRQQK